MKKPTCEANTIWGQSLVTVIKLTVKKKFAAKFTTVTSRVAVLKRRARVKTVHITMLERIISANNVPRTSANACECFIVITVIVDYFILCISVNGIASVLPVVNTNNLKITIRIWDTEGSVFLLFRTGIVV